MQMFIDGFSSVKDYPEDSLKAFSNDSGLREMGILSGGWHFGKMKEKR